MADISPFGAPPPPLPVAPGSRKRSNPEPAVSVLIAANGPEERLAWQLAALAAQDYPGRLLEVVVAFGGTIAFDPPPVRPPHCRFISYDGDMPPRTEGCNAAAAAADGQVYLLLDAASIPLPDLVSRHAAHHRHDRSAAVVGGRLRPAEWPPRGPAYSVLAALSQGAAAELAEHPDPFPETQGLPFTRALPVSVSRGAFNRVGGFDPRMTHGGELDLLHRLRIQGADVIAEPEARTWYIGPAPDESEARRLAPFLEQRFPRNAERPPGVAHRVPAVDVVVDLDSDAPHSAEARLRPLLEQARTDLRVTLVPAEPGAAAKLERHFAGEPRVRVTSDPSAADPRSAAPRTVRVAVGQAIDPALLVDDEPDHALVYLTERIREATRA